MSIDLAVHGRDPQPRPPVEAYLRVIDEPVLRLVSVDLNTVAEITTVAEVFDYARDYLGLLKAAVIAAGLVPPGIERSGTSLAELLAQVFGPGRGFELVSFWRPRDWLALDLVYTRSRARLDSPEEDAGFIGRYIEGSVELSEKASSTDKTLKKWEGLHHDLLHEPERDQVAEFVTSWIEAHLPK